MSVLIIDYGMGNLGSVKRALEECGAQDVEISHEESAFDSCSHAILPGVGSFADAMNNLHQANLVKRIQKLALEENIPLLGICLGMQLLASEGEENGFSSGLGLIPGRVVALKPLTNERIPHVGWNEISKLNPHPLLENIRDRSDFYYVHSYHFQAENSNDCIASTPYCGEFTSIVARANIMGTQFHPEKSSHVGFQILKNFLTL